MPGTTPQHQPDHDPVPSPTPSPEPGQEIPAHDPPVFPAKDEVVFNEDEVAK